MLALALKRRPTGHPGQNLELDIPPPEHLLKEAFELHEGLTGRLGSTTDTDEDYSSLLFYWSR